jgi:hypothetical protein
LHCTSIPPIHFNGSNGTAYTGLLCPEQGGWVWMNLENIANRYYSGEFWWDFGIEDRASALFSPLSKVFQ